MYVLREITRVIINIPSAGIGLDIAYSRNQKAFQFKT